MTENIDPSLLRYLSRMMWIAFLISLGSLLLLALPTLLLAETILLLGIVFLLAEILTVWWIPRYGLSARLLTFVAFVYLVVIIGLDLFLHAYLELLILISIPIIVFASLFLRPRVVLAFIVIVVAGNLAIEFIQSEPRTLTQIAVDAFILAASLGAVLSLAEQYRRVLQLRWLEQKQRAETNAQTEQLRRHEAEAEAQRWQVLNYVATRLLAANTLTEILEIVTHELRQLDLQWQVALWREPGVSLYLPIQPSAKRMVNIIRRLTGVDLATLTIRVDDFPALKASIESRTSMLVENAQTTLPSFLSQIPSRRVEEVLTILNLSRMIYVPMAARDQVLGGAYVWGKGLASASEPTIYALVQHVALALQKARVMEQEHHRALQMELAGEIAARAMQAEEPDAMLATIVKLVQERFGYYHVCVMLYDPLNEELVQRAVAGTNAQAFGVNYRTSLQDGLLGLAARTQRTVFSNDVLHDPRYVAGPDELENSHSELCVPLLSAKTLLGVLDIETDTINAFDQNGVAALETLAAQFAVALEKARLLATERKRATQLQVVNNIATQAAAASDPDAILWQTVHLTLINFRLYNVGIFLNEPDKRRAHLAAHAGKLESKVEFPYYQSWAVGIIGHVASSGEKYLARNVKHDRFYKTPDEITDADPVLSELAIPLKYDNRVVGVMDMQSERLDDFDMADEIAYETLADQVASVLEKARLLAAEQKRATQLELVSEIAAQCALLTDPNELVRAVTHHIQEKFRYRLVSLLANDPVGRVVRRLASSGNLSELTPLDYTQSWDSGIIGWAARNGETYVANDVQQDPYYFALLPGEDVIRAELVVPLKQGNQVIAFLDVESDRVDAFDKSDVDAMQTLARQISTALEKARLISETEQRAKELTALREAELALVAENDTSRLLNLIIERAMQIINADAGLLYVLDEAVGILDAVVAKNQNQKFRGARVRLGEGLAGRVAQSGEAMFVEDYSLWELRSRDFDDQRIYALIGLPLIWQGHTLGVITLERRPPHGKFNLTDLELGNLFAVQAAVVLNNARLRADQDKLIHSQETMIHITRHFLQLNDAREIVALGANKCVDLVTCEGVLIWGLDDGESLTVVAQRGWQPTLVGNLRVSVTDDSFSAEALREKRAMHWNDLSEPRAENRLLTGVPPFVAAVAVPMVVGERAVGVITLTRNALAEFTQAEVHSISLLANQMASALERARYFEQVQESARELNILYETQRSIASSLSQREVFARLLEQLGMTFQVTSVFFSSVDLMQRTVTWEQEYYSAEATALERDDSARVQRIDDNPDLVRMLEHGAIALDATDATLMPSVKAYMDKFAVFSILRVPMRVAEQLIGYISLWETRQPRKWSEREIRLIESMASQAAVALANARSFQDTATRSRELEALYQAGQRLNASLSVQGICDAGVQALAEILGYSHISIYLLQGHSLILQTERGYKVSIEVMHVSTGIVGRAARSKQTIFLPDAHLDPDFLEPDAGIQSEIAVPLLRSEHVIGVLNVETAKGQLLTPNDARLLNTFANQLSTAIENARLYQDARRRLHETETLYEFTKVLGETLEIRELGERALRTIEQLMPYDLGSLGLLDHVELSTQPIAFGGRAWHNLDTHARDKVKSRAVVPIGKGLIGHSAEWGESVRIDNWQTEKRFEPAEAEVNSELSVPLRIGDQVIGVLDVQSFKPNAFDEQDERLLAALAGQLAVAIENARLYEQTRKEADVKAALLRELSHRVKNNLAAITSLLYFALDNQDLSREQILNETVSRVKSMTAAHALLAESPQARIRLNQLGHIVLSDSIRQLAYPSSHIELQVEGGDVEIAARQATSLALVLNELATNAIRHGLKNGDGVLRLHIARQGGTVQLELDDNGVGVPNNFDLENQKGIGLSLIRTLVEKDLNGAFKLESNGHGTKARVEFKLVP